MLKIWQPMLADLLFFFCAGFVISGFSEKMLDLMLATGTLSVRQIESMKATESVWTFLSADPQLREVAIKLAGVMVLMALSVWLVFVIIQAVAWTMAGSWSQQVDKRQYLKRFATVNILWGILFLIYLTVSFLSQLRQNLLERVAPELVPTHWSTYLGVALGFLLALAMLSYAYSFKQKPRQAIKSVVMLMVKQPVRVLVWAVILVGGLFLLNAFIGLIDKIDTDAGLLIGAILFLAGMTVARVFTIEVVQHAKR